MIYWEISYWLVDDLMGWIPCSNLERKKEKTQKHLWFPTACTDFLILFNKTKFTYLGSCCKTKYILKPTFLSFVTQVVLFGMQIICINTALGLDFNSKGCFWIKRDKAAWEVCIQEVRNYPFTVSFFPPCPKAIAKHRNTACYM